jgi:asparagine synthase (glutamine-hydrolysing)
MLDGMFSFVLLDLKNNTFMAARDPVGITTFYYGTNSKDGSIWFSRFLLFFLKLNILDLI